MVFYRKYRPQTLDELVGQESVKQALKSALSSDKLSHAYLFCGPRGTGKTSTARILAKIVNCSAKQNIPCNNCEMCISITDGSNLDVIEMDAASNRGIDDIRSLKENIKLSPTASKKKVYIIDEVHMLSGEAFNALLKTLEEPPSHVLFILATTEVQKIPQTILSRVSKLDFRLATEEELAEAIKKVAEIEKIKVEDGALKLLTKAAQGSFRDGVKLLDLLSGFKIIDEAVVQETLRTGVLENTCLLLGNIAQKETVKALKNITEDLEKGVSSKELNLSILETLRQILLVKHGLGKKYPQLENLDAKFSLEHLVKTINCFQTALEQSRYVSIPALPLELAVVESCGNLEIEKKLDVRNGKIEKEIDPPAGGLNSRNLDDQEIKTSKIQSFDKLRIDPECNRMGQDQEYPTSNIKNSNTDLAKIAEKWAYILETIRAYNFSLEALLRNAKITECAEKNIVIEVPYSFHQRILEAPKSRDLLESIFADILGRSIKVSTILGQRSIKREEIANIEIAADDEIVRIASEIFNSEPN